MSELTSAWAMLGLKGPAQPTFACADCGGPANTLDQAYMKTFLLAQVLHLSERAQMAFFGLVMTVGLEQWLTENCRMNPPDVQSAIARACELGLLERTLSGYEMAAPRCKICWSALASDLGLTTVAIQLIALKPYPANRVRPPTG